MGAFLYSPSHGFRLMISLSAAALFDISAVGQTNVAPKLVLDKGHEWLEPSATPGQWNAKMPTTEWERYKAKVYSAVGARWYGSLPQNGTLMGNGKVHVQFTICENGKITTKVLDKRGEDAEILLRICLDSLNDGGPFEPFTASLKQEIAKATGGDGRSYTDNFSFSLSNDEKATFTQGTK